MIAENFRIGDRVVLRKGHPWHGYSGEVTDADPVGPFQMLLVALDNGQRCFADPKELQRV